MGDKEIMSLNKRMFTPTKKRSHIGGDYTAATNDVIPQSTMDLIAQLSGISNFAEMSSFASLNSLSTDQISHLINILGDDIINNNELEWMNFKD